MPSTTFHLPESLLSRVDRAAKRKGLSRNRFVIQACERALEEDAGSWPEGFFESCLPDDDRDLLEDAVREMDLEILRNRRNRALLEHQRDRYLGQFRWLPWNHRASVLYGEIKSFLESSGQLIDDFDVAISAIARSHNAEVLTANLVHFARVPDLSCRSWV
jgi:predicted nucleic acid-binding protein